MDASNRVKCPFCELIFDPENIVVTRIRGGKYLIFSCPECGTILSIKQK